MEQTLQNNLQLDTDFPQKLYEEINKLFGPFTVDVCKERTLKQSWSGKCWLYPKRGRDLPKWIEKASKEIKDNPECTIIAAFIPARTDTNWWHKFVFGKTSALFFLQGRIEYFVEEKKKKFPPYALVIYDKTNKHTRVGAIHA